MPAQEDLKLKAKKLLHTAADASKKLEESVRELVTMRAWTVLGYENFSEMWEKENGFKVPLYAKNLATEALVAEGMNTGRGRNPKTGHTTVDVAKAVGYATHTRPNGDVTSGSAHTAITQLKAGVPADKVIGTSHGARVSDNIATNGTRARAQPRRMGKAPDELVSDSISLSRRASDEVADIAREANVPKTEIYRQAVTEYLARHRASRPVSFSGGTK